MISEQMPWNGADFSKKKHGAPTQIPPHLQAFGSALERILQVTAWHVVCVTYGMAVISP